MALRQRAKQARATFLLSLDERWAELKEQRHQMFNFRRNMGDDVDRANPGVKDAAREMKLRTACKEKIEELRDDPDEIHLYQQFFNYLAFFETVGLMVRKRYVPLRDVVMLYKGPIFDIDIVFREHLEEWQQHGNVPKGLLENVLFLIKWTRRYDWLERNIMRWR
jgi:hypothetical protein